MAIHVRRRPSPSEFGPDSARRSAAVSGGGAVLAGMAASSQAALEPEEKQGESQLKPEGYRETAHVREYYAKARF